MQQENAKKCLASKQELALGESNRNRNLHCPALPPRELMVQTRGYATCADRTPGQN
jgi:hypothetical protein